jgi:hypothetical protein
MKGYALTYQVLVTISVKAELSPVDSFIVFRKTIYFNENQ